jgi:hypothetical protein
LFPNKIFRSAYFTNTFTIVAIKELTNFCDYKYGFHCIPPLPTLTKFDLWYNVIRYELHAIRLAKLKMMAIENEESSDTIGFEVEMAETKQSANLAPPTS